MQANTNIESFQKCQNIYQIPPNNIEIGNDMLCATGKAQIPSPGAYSRGPLFQNMSSGSDFLCEIASFCNGTCTGDYPSVFKNDNLLLMWSTSEESGVLQCTVHQIRTIGSIKQSATSDWNHFTAFKSKSKANAKITTMLHAMMTII